MDKRQLKPLETTAVQTIAVETTAVKTITVETAAVETAAVETAAIETTAVENAAVETAAVENAAVENAVETAAVETTAVETAAGLARKWTETARKGTEIQLRAKAAGNGAERPEYLQRSLKCQRPQNSCTDQKKVKNVHKGPERDVHQGGSEPRGVRKMGENTSSWWLPTPILHPAHPTCGPYHIPETTQSIEEWQHRHRNIATMLFGCSIFMWVRIRLSITHLTSFLPHIEDWSLANLFALCP